MRTPLKTNLPIILLIGAIGVQTFTSCSSDDIDDILGGTSSSSGGGTPSSSSGGLSSSGGGTSSSSGGSSSSGSGIPIGGWRTCPQISSISEQCYESAEAEYMACSAEGGDDCYEDNRSNASKCSFFGVACNGISTASCMEHYQPTECFADIFLDGGDNGDYCHIEYYDGDGDYSENCLLIGERAIIYSKPVCLNVRGGEVITYRECRSRDVYVNNDTDTGDMGNYCHYRNDCDLIGGKYTYSEEHCLDEREGEIITYTQCKNKGARIFNETSEGEEEWEEWD